MDRSINDVVDAEEADEGSGSDVIIGEGEGDHEEEEIDKRTVENGEVGDEGEDEGDDESSIINDGSVRGVSQEDDEKCGSYFDHVPVGHTLNHKIHRIFIQGILKKLASRSIMDFLKIFFV